MYNEKYISDFDLKMYDYYLSDPNKLKELADAYINQYNNPTFDCTIAFKESLDHYIFKQIIENPVFKKSQLFWNYLKYINYIYSNRVSDNIQLEYNTNILFQNENTKNVILSYYNSDNRKKISETITQNEGIVNNIFEKLSSGEELNTEELNLISDYLYTRRDLSDSRHSLFIEYVLNVTINNKATPQIIAAYISYLPKVFGEGCENNRAILSNGISKPKNIETIIPSEINQNKGKNLLRMLGLYSHGDKYISMGWNMLEGLDLNSDASLNISRTIKQKDIYWLVMTSFHEMTHQLQHNAMKSNTFNSSGLSQLIKLAKGRDDDALNHDSIESEIEADENAWKKMYNFIFKYRSNSKFQTDQQEVRNQLRKCSLNEESVYARRALQTKYNSDDRFFDSDMTKIKTLFDNPNLRYKDFFRKLQRDYPMMSMIFDENGKIRTSIMFLKGLTSENVTGNDENILCCELSNHILNNGYEVLKRHILSDNLSKEQIINLLMNVYNTYHLEKKYVNSLSKLDFSQLEETHINIDYNNNDVLRKKYLEKFINVANLVFKERELIAIINKRYPEYNIEESFPPKYVIWNYNDMLNHLLKVSNGTLEEDDLIDIITKYLNSSDPVLVELANYTKKYIKEKEQKEGIKQTSV